MGQNIHELFLKYFFPGPEKFFAFTQIRRLIRLDVSKRPAPKFCRSL